MSALETRSALAGLVKPGRRGVPDSENPVKITERRLAVVQVQARKGQEAAAKAAIANTFGLELPDAGRSSVTIDHAAVWVQPSTWLVGGTFTEPGALARRIAEATAGTAAVTDQTFGKSVLRLSGTHARSVLSKGCRIDLHPREFGAGRSAVTPLGHISCVIVQIDDTPTYDLIVPSTFAVAAVEWLEMAAAEFGYEMVSAG